VVDEAQNLEPAVLETVRLLSDFETPQAKLMHIILSGQPELADKLARPSLHQLRQRVSIMHGLEPLPAWEVKSYIEHRLRIAGYEGEPLFTPEAYESIATFTHGIPRNVNNFCFNALSLACALREKVVNLDIVKEVTADLDISRLLSTFPDQERFPRVQPVAPTMPEFPASPPVRQGAHTLSPDEARAYMQKLAWKLKNWQDAKEKDRNGSSPTQVATPRDGQKG